MGNSKIVSFKMEESDLVWLLHWFHQQCDGDWEHGNGVRISTIESPGWSLKVSISETVCENENFQEVIIDRTETDWVYCCLRHETFEGACGLHNLPEVLKIFREWVERCEKKYLQR
jgi:hypothetical protein